MTTSQRVQRFDQDLLNDVISSGSILNNSMASEGIVRSNKNTKDPTIAMVSYPVKINEFSSEKINELYDIEFTEFVDEEESNENQEVDPNLEFLQNRLNSLTTELEKTSEIISLSTAQKETIINLRIQLGEGSSVSDFSEDFPYLPLP